MGSTKKVKSTGRFGSRYGVGIRKRLLKVEAAQAKKKACPNCGSPRVRRSSRGIFSCRKCGHEFVGGAYFPSTLTGGLIAKMVSQKNFASAPSDLVSEALKGAEAEATAEAGKPNEGRGAKGPNAAAWPRHGGKVRAKDYSPEASKEKKVKAEKKGKKARGEK